MSKPPNATMLTLWLTYMVKIKVKAATRHYSRYFSIHNGTPFWIRGYPFLSRSHSGPQGQEDKDRGKDKVANRNAAQKGQEPKTIVLVNVVVAVDSIFVVVVVVVVVESIEFVGSSFGQWPQLLYSGSIFT